MNKTSKKIIAREFLFLLGTTILFFVLLFIWISLTESNHDKQNEIKTEIEEFKENNQLVNNELLKLETKSSAEGLTRMNEEFLQYLYDTQDTEASFEDFKIDFQKNEDFRQYLYDDLDKESSFEDFKNDFQKDEGLQQSLYDALDTESSFEDFKNDFQKDEGFQRHLYDALDTEFSLFEDFKNDFQKDEGLQQSLYDALDTESSFEEFKNDFKTNEKLQRLAYNKLDTNASFEKFLKNVLGENEIEKSTELKTLEKKLQKAKSSMFNDSGVTEEDEVFRRIGLTLFSIFFIFRYLIYVTKWSIRQLKE